MRGRVDCGLCAYSIRQAQMKEAKCKRMDQLRAPETSHAFVLKAMLSSRCLGVDMAAGMLLSTVKHQAHGIFLKTGRQHLDVTAV